MVKLPPLKLELSSDDLEEYEACKANWVLKTAADTNVDASNTKKKTEDHKKEVHERIGLQSQKK